MNNRTENASRKSPAPHSLWIKLEAPEIIELKRIALDRDGEGAVVFFRDILTPRVRAVAFQRGLALDLLAKEANDERIPG